MDAWDQAIALAPACPADLPGDLHRRLLRTACWTGPRRSIARGASPAKTRHSSRSNLPSYSPPRWTIPARRGSTSQWLAANPAQISFIQGRMGAFSWKPEGRTAAISAVREALRNGENLRLYELLGLAPSGRKGVPRRPSMCTGTSTNSRPRTVWPFWNLRERVFRERAYDVAPNAYREALGRELPTQRIPQARFGAACAAMELQIARDSLQITGTPDLRPASESRTRFAGALASFDAIVNEYPEHRIRGDGPVPERHDPPPPVFRSGPGTADIPEGPDSAGGHAAPPHRRATPPR